jgi:hypothetical protein
LADNDPRGFGRGSKTEYCYLSEWEAFDEKENNYSTLFLRGLSDRFIHLFLPFYLDKNADLAAGAPFFTIWVSSCL